MKLNIGVFFGGKSTEHEISCITANQVINALDKEKYNIIPIYISKNGDLYSGDKLFDLSNYASFIDNPDTKLTKVCIFKDGPKTRVDAVKNIFWNAKTIDVAFPVVHGTNVEDGSLAGYLQMLDLPYTSCDVLGGAIGQDKAVMKDLFKTNNIPMVDYFVINENDFEENKKTYLAKAKKLKFPVIAKPANLGSSVGIEIINKESEFLEKIEECLKYDYKVVVEKMIRDLKEVNISVVGSINDAKVSVIEEVTNGFLDYSKKYQPNGSKGSKKLPAKAPKVGASKGMASTARKIPADVSPSQKKAIEETAKNVFRVLNANGCVRIDFMIDKKNKKVYCNEINTIPGSLAFYLWEESGLNFTMLCDELISNAMKRYASRSKKQYTFDTNILKNYEKKQ